jgi:hypothetical protein
MSEWQPIETAPKDGTTVLVYGMEMAAEPYAIIPYACRWSADRSRWIEAGGEGWASCDPSFWMPLPVPPSLPQ